MPSTDLAYGTSCSHYRMTSRALRTILRGGSSAEGALNQEQQGVDADTTSRMHDEGKAEGGGAAAGQGAEGSGMGSAVAQGGERKDEGGGGVHVQDHVGGAENVQNTVAHVSDEGKGQPCLNWRDFKV
eukprot:3212601-Rhodomonas_salina.2